MPSQSHEFEEFENRLEECNRYLTDGATSIHAAGAGEMSDHSQRDAIVRHLLEKHAENAWRIVWGVLRHSHDADDVMQRAITRVLEKWQSVPEDPGHARLWFFKVAALEARDFRRTRARREAYAVRLGDNWEPRNATESADSMALTADMQSVVAKAISELPDDLRDVIELSLTEELSTEDISQILDIPSGTVKTRKMRAREELSRKPELRELLGVGLPLITIPQPVGGYDDASERWFSKARKGNVASALAVGGSAGVSLASLKTSLVSVLGLIAAVLILVAYISNQDAPAGVGLFASNKRPEAASSEESSSSLTVERSSEREPSPANSGKESDANAESAPADSDAKSEEAVPNWTLNTVETPFNSSLGGGMQFQYTVRSDNGRRHGIQYTYTPAGDLEAEAVYNNGDLVSQLRYDEFRNVIGGFRPKSDGSGKTEAVYPPQRPIKEDFSLEYHERRFPSGALYMTWYTRSDTGRKHGLVTKYLANGYKTSSALYRNGRSTEWDKESEPATTDPYAELPKLDRERLSTSQRNLPYPLPSDVYPFLSDEFFTALRKIWTQPTPLLEVKAIERESTIMPQKQKYVMHAQHELKNRAFHGPTYQCMPNLRLRAFRTMTLSWYSEKTRRWSYVFQDGARMSVVKIYDASGEVAWQCSQYDDGRRIVCASDTRLGDLQVRYFNGSKLVSSHPIGTELPLSWPDDLPVE